MRFEGSVLDYLRAMEDLNERGIPLRNGAIAEWLGVRPPSVTRMVERLRLMGLVQGEVRTNLELTNDGIRLARRSVRRHRLIETWLVRSLSLPWHIAHEEAHTLEHALSPRLEEEIDHRLGRPALDPHGAAIPDREGRTASFGLKPLASLADGDSGVVARLNDRDPEKLDYWRSIGVAMGSRIKRTCTGPYGEVVHLSVDGVNQQVGPRALDGVWVRLAEEQHV